MTQTPLIVVNQHGNTLVFKSTLDRLRLVEVRILMLLVQSVWSLCVYGSEIHFTKVTSHTEHQNYGNDIEATIYLIKSSHPPCPLIIYNSFLQCSLLHTSGLTRSPNNIVQSTVRHSCHALTIKDIVKACAYVYLIYFLYSEQQQVKATTKRSHLGT